VRASISATLSSMREKLACAARIEVEDDLAALKTKVQGS
jgi:hypothetical protein